MISPLAYVDPAAQIGNNVEIGPFCYIDKNVVIGDDCVLMPHVTVLYGTRMGNGNQIFPGAVIGAIPQDLKFVGEETELIIGDRNRIRENVTMNRGTASRGKTVVGSDNLFMEGVHVAHDCIVGNRCIIGNQTKIAGEVVIDDFATISSTVLIHQFCHIGGHVMIQGGCGIPKDVPPFIMAAREPVAYMGINIVGLRRHGYDREQIERIHSAYRTIYQSGMNVTQALNSLKQDSIFEFEEIKYIASFIESSGRGIIRD